MLGKISLDYADLFGNGTQPCIVVSLAPESTDPRDKLLCFLFESVGNDLGVYFEQHRKDKPVVTLFRKDREKFPQPPPIQNFGWAILQMACGYKVRRKGDPGYYILDQNTGDYLRQADNGNTGSTRPIDFMDHESLKAKDWEVVDDRT